MKLTLLISTLLVCIICLGQQPTSNAGAILRDSSVQNLVKKQSISSSVLVQKLDSILDARESAAAQSKPANDLIKDTSNSLGEIADTTIFTFRNILLSIIVFIINWFLIKLIQLLLEKFAERSTKHRITIKGFIPLAAILLWILAVYIVVLNIFDPPRETLIAGLASAGLAVGFAAQDIIKNIFAGLVIIFDSPFKVGDKIEVGSHYGEVMQIGLRSTKITTPDDSMVTVPNSELMNNSVSNSNSGEANCQVVAEIFLPPDVDTVLVRKKAIEAAQVSKYIYLNKPIAVLFFNVVEEGTPFIKMRLKAYVSDIRHEFAFKSDMTELVIKELYSAGILNQTYFMNHGS